MIKTDVLIVGAGPTGLMAACQLARFGVNLLIIDAKPGVTAQSRALLITARSMEIYQEMGLSDRVIAGGQSISDLSIYMAGKEKIKLSLGKAGEGLTDFPYLQSFEQSRNEELLYAELRKWKIDVSWNTEFLHLEQSAKGVTAEVRDLLSERVWTINARYLIGCDGASSSVRQMLKCRFDGRTYENKFFVADTKIKWAQPGNQVIAAPSKWNFCAFFPMYERGSYRILGSLPRKYAAEAAVAFNDIEAVIRSTVQIPMEFKNVNWFSVYRLHQRCVTNFKVGNCFLAGDAAHIHSPAGGQGMNTGLQDAHNLSWKLWMVLQGEGGELLLSTYHNERYPFALWLLKFTDRIFSYMTSGNAWISGFRKYLLPGISRIVSGSPQIKKRFFNVLAQIWYSYGDSLISVTRTCQSLKFAAGDRFPYMRLEYGNEMVSSYELLRAPKFHLVCLGPEEEVAPDIIPDNLARLICFVNLDITAGWMKLGISRKTYILVRPDNYIGLICDQLENHTLGDYFGTYR
ncbi:MAG: FAD-dependent monooxygenase [Mucilaginibacter sp.]